MKNENEAFQQLPATSSNFLEKVQIVLALEG